MRITWMMGAGSRKLGLLAIALLIFFTSPLPATHAVSQEEKKSGVSIGKATGIGALLGLGLGQSLGGVISGAAIGAAGG